VVYAKKDLGSLEEDYGIETFGADYPDCAAQIVCKECMNKIKKSYGR